MADLLRGGPRFHCELNDPVQNSPAVTAGIEPDTVLPGMCPVPWESPYKVNCLWLVRPRTPCCFLMILSRHRYNHSMMMFMNPGEQALLVGDKASATLEDGILRIYPSHDMEAEPRMTLRLLLGGVRHTRHNRVLRQFRTQRVNLTQLNAIDDTDPFLHSSRTLGRRLSHVGHSNYVSGQPVAVFLLAGTSVLVLLHRIVHARLGIVDVP